MTGSDLAPRSDSALSILRTLEDGGLLTATSFDLPSADLSFEHYEMIGRWLGQVRDTSAWWLADYLIFGEGIYGEKYSQAVEATGRSIRTLQNYAYIGGAVAKSRRRADLSFSHHGEVAKLEAAEQVKWLSRSAAEGWSVETLRHELRENGHGPAEQPVWSERERSLRERETQAVLAEMVELAADPDGAARMPALAERAQRALQTAVVPVGKRRLRCPACSHEFEDDA